MFNTTLQANQANSMTGALAIGGGIRVAANASLQAINSTFSGNTTGGAGINFGGAIQSPNLTTLTLVQSTFDLNDADNGDAISAAGTTTLRGNVFDQGVGGCGIGGTLVADAFNVDEATSCVGAANDDDIENAPNLDLAALAFNGGRTATHALNLGSDGIDAVPAGECDDLNTNPLLLDQRGAERPFNGACDAGSYERVTCDGQLPTSGHLGGEGDDTLTGSSGADVIIGSAGNDTIDGMMDYADRICGGSGNDTLTGGAGLDELYGEADDDNLQAKEGEADVVDPRGPGADMFLADNALTPHRLRDRPHPAAGHALSDRRGPHRPACRGAEEVRRD